MTIIYFIIMLGVVITVHEFGHMIVGKLCGMYVREFSIGWGPKLFQIKGKETAYTLRLIPLGGYTAFVDENVVDEAKYQQKQEKLTSEEAIEDSEQNKSEQSFQVPEHRTFYGSHPLKRIATLIAGPLFNVVLSILIAIGIYVSIGQAYIYPEAIITQVSENSPAMQAGVQAGDKIISYQSNGKTVNVNDSYDILSANIQSSDVITLTIEREGNTITIDVVPTYFEEEQRYIMGITFNQPTVHELTFGECCKKGFEYTIEITVLTVKSIVQLITGKLGLDNLSGTIGIYSYTKEAVSYGFVAYLSLVTSISVSIGIMNLVPLPVFDGGRIVLTFVEMIVGHRLNKKVEEIITYIGLGLIVLLFILTAYLDISKLVK